MRVLIILPAYNEEASILKTINMVENYANDQFEIDYIVINDGSTDSTKEILEKEHKNTIELICNLGIGGAVQTGYKYAQDNNYDVAVQFDGDGQHDINSLADLLDPIIKEEANFVVGSRFVEGATTTFKSTLLRQFGIKVISFFIKVASGVKVYDTTSGYRAADKKAIEFLAHNYPVKYPEPESLVMLSKQGFKIKETPVNMFEREEGMSSITPVKSVFYMIEVCSALLILSFKKTKEY